MLVMRFSKPRPDRYGFLLPTCNPDEASLGALGSTFSSVQLRKPKKTIRHVSLMIVFFIVFGVSG